MKAQIVIARRARKGIEQLRKQLLCPTPETLGACAAPLAQAMECMERLEAGLRQVPTAHETAKELGVEIVCLRRELAQAGALLRSAAEFYEGYGRLLRLQQDACVDYSRIGATSPPHAARRLVIHG